MEAFQGFEWLDGMLGLLVGTTALAVAGTCILWTIPMPQPYWVRGEGECGDCGGTGGLAVESPPRCACCEAELGGE